MNIGRDRTKYLMNEIYVINKTDKNNIKIIWYKKLWKLFYQNWYSNWWTSDFKWFVYWDLFKDWNPSLIALNKTIWYNAYLNWWNVLRWYYKSYS